MLKIQVKIFHHTMCFWSYWLGNAVSKVTWIKYERKPKEYQWTPAVPSYSGDARPRMHTYVTPVASVSSWRPSQSSCRRCRRLWSTCSTNSRLTGRPGSVNAPSSSASWTRAARHTWLTSSASPSSSPRSERHLATNSTLNQSVPIQL